MVKTEITEVTGDAFPFKPREAGDHQAAKSAEDPAVAAVAAEMQDQRQRLFDGVGANDVLLPLRPLFLKLHLLVTTFRDQVLTEDLIQSFQETLEQLLAAVHAPLARGTEMALLRERAADLADEDADSETTVFHAQTVLSLSRAEVTRAYGAAVAATKVLSVMGGPVFRLNTVLRERRDQKISGEVFDELIAAVAALKQAVQDPLEEAVTQSLRRADPAVPREQEA